MKTPSGGNGRLLLDEAHFYPTSKSFSLSVCSRLRRTIAAYHEISGGPFLCVRNGPLSGLNRRCKSNSIHCREIFVCARRERLAASGGRQALYAFSTNSFSVLMVPFATSSGVVHSDTTTSTAPLMTRETRPMLTPKKLILPKVKITTETMPASKP